MAILANRIRTKNHLIELASFMLLLLKRFFVLTLIFISCYLLYFSSPRILSTTILEMTGKTLSAGALIYKESVLKIKWVYNKILYFKDLEAENLRLKLKVAELKDYYHTAMLLKTENVTLRRMLKVTEAVPQSYVTARIVGLAFSPYTHTAIVEAGSSSNVKIDDIVRGEGGLMGRVSNVSSNYSTVMLISDHNSRIPVIAGTSKERGIIAKQGDDLKIIYLKENHSAKVGEILYTSGDGKIYPHGMKVAIIEKINEEGVFVKMSVDLDDSEFVIVESTSEKYLE